MQVGQRGRNDSPQRAIEELERADRRLAKVARALREVDKAEAPEADLLAEEVADVLTRLRAQRVALEIKTETQPG